jgi:hypothetical protein
VDEHTMPWTVTVAVVDTQDPPPAPPIWRPGESLEAFERALERWVREMVRWARHHHHPHPRPLVGFRITIGGSSMGDVQISVDATNESAGVEWVDDHGDVLAQGPTDTGGGAVSVQLSSSDTSVLEVPAGGGQLTLHAAGTATISGAAVDSAGNPYPPDGQWTASSTVEVDPGAAAGFRVQVQQGV